MERPLRKAQDGHSLTEELVYVYLWKRGGKANSGDLYRETTVGYRTLAKRLQVSVSTVKRTIRSLTKKLAISPIPESYDRRSNSPMRVKVYSYTAICDRRKLVGLDTYTGTSPRGNVNLIFSAPACLFMPAEEEEDSSIPLTEIEAKIEAQFVNPFLKKLLATLEFVHDCLLKSPHRKYPDLPHLTIKEWQLLNETARLICEQFVRMLEALAKPCEPSERCELTKEFESQYEHLLAEFLRTTCANSDKPTIH